MNAAEVAAVVVLLAVMGIAVVVLVLGVLGYLRVRAGARQPAVERRMALCAHLDVEPVESVIDGHVLAHLCQGCGEQLPADLPATSSGLVAANRAAIRVVPVAAGADPDCGDCEWIEERRLCDPVPTYVRGRPCPKHARSSW